MNFTYEKNGKKDYCTHKTNLGVKVKSKDRVMSGEE